jgi:hypothetical protein
MGGAGGGTVITGSSSDGGSLKTIIPHNQPLSAGAPIIDPGTGAIIQAAVWTDIAFDSDGDAFIVDVYAEGANGSTLIEVAVMRDKAKRTGYSQVYEVKTGSPPTLTFDAYSASNDTLTLRMHSSDNLVTIRGRILYI